MTNKEELKHGPIGDHAVHICVDMQRMFADSTAWKMPWLDKVLPHITAIVEERPERTIFTRFVPADEPGQGAGTWKRYYERWSCMTISELGPEMVDVVPSLSRFTPPARVFDKLVYSPWTGTNLHEQLRGSDVSTVIITGGETDVCVLATMLGAIDWGFRVILVTDALCSSADETHDAMMNIYRSRFSEQIETATTELILDSWSHSQRFTVRA
jgi:nicotinamidase-related amidase